MVPGLGPGGKLRLLAGHRLGDGQRLFPEHGQTHTLEVVESRTTPSGVMIQTYRPAGRATFGIVGG